MDNSFNPLRYWTDSPGLMPYLDDTDAALDREDSLSDRYAFQLGEDIGRLRFPVDIDLHSEVRRGYQHGLKLAQKSAPIYVRKLLNLRLNAFHRSIPVSSALTQDYLKSITVTVCPVSGESLTQGTLSDSDWSIDRLDNGVGYVPGNLCVMSTRVNRLKDRAAHQELAASSFESLFREGPDGLHKQIDGGLTVLETLRLAALTAGPHCVARGLVARYIPLAAAPSAWGTVDATVAGMHMQCARTRVEGPSYAKRLRFFKRIGADQWRKSNLLVRELRSALSRGEHPADVWFDGRATQLLIELTDALLRGPIEIQGVTPEMAFEIVTSGIAPVKHYRR